MMPLIRMLTSAFTLTALAGAVHLSRAQDPPTRTPPVPQMVSGAADSAEVAGRRARPGQTLVTLAAQEYRDGGKARTIVEGRFVTYPHGHAQPVVTCAVLRACVIELEPGEVVLSKIAGDTERWEIVPAPAGPDGRTTLVVVKPRDCDISTNLVLATDRRLYDLTLDAPPCPVAVADSPTNPQQPYVRHVRFYYPDDLVVEWSRPEPVRVAADVVALNFRYRVKKDKQFPWAPAQVFDDGARTYIKLPSDARHAEAPVLFVLEKDGSKTLMNYTLMGGDTYVTDRVFERAVLVVGVDGKERRVLLERQRGD